MLPLIGFAAVALGMMAFDVVNSADEDVRDDTLIEDKTLKAEETEYLSLDTEADICGGIDEIDFVPESDLKEISDTPFGVVVGESSESALTLEASGPDDNILPVVDGVEKEPSSEEIDDLFHYNSSETETTCETELDAPEEGMDNKEATPVIAGTNEADLLYGANVHIDIATGIVELFGSSAESLSGGSGNDTLAISAGDVALGGEGADEFVVDGQLTGKEVSAGSVPIISDFMQGQDQIVVSIPTTENQLEQVYPGRPSSDFVLTYTCENDETSVLVDGLLVCKLAGEFDLTDDDVSVRYDYYSSLKTDFDERYGY